MIFSISKLHPSGSETPMFLLNRGEVDNKFHNMRMGETRPYNPDVRPNWMKKADKTVKYQIKRGG